MSITRGRSIPLYLAAALLLGAGLSSCGLVKAPFKVAGAVVDGTAYVGKKAYDASAAPFKKSPEEKAQEEKEKAAKEAKEKKEAAEKAAKQGGQPQVPGTPTPQPQPAPPPLPQSEGQVPANEFLPKSPDELPPPPR